MIAVAWILEKSSECHIGYSEPPCIQIQVKIIFEWSPKTGIEPTYFEGQIAFDSRLFVKEFDGGNPAR